MKEGASSYADLKARRDASTISADDFHEALLDLQSKHVMVGDSLVALVAGYDCTRDGAERLELAEPV